MCKDIDVYKSSAIDNLSARVLKDAFMTIPNVMSTLFNLSLLQGTYPNKWKTAKIVPLFKGGEKTLVKNYRPVSLLPLPGKLLEKIVHSRMANYFDTYGLLNTKQDGVRSGCFTIDTVAKFTDDVLININKACCSLAVFI